MDKVQALIKTSPIIKMGSFWETAKTTPQSVSAYLDKMPSDIVVKVWFENVLIAAKIYTKVMNKILRSEEEKEEALEKYMQLFQSRKVWAASQEVLELTLKAVEDVAAYATEKIEELSEVDETRESLSGIFDELAGETAGTGKVVTIDTEESIHNVKERMNLFLASEGKIVKRVYPKNGVKRA